MDLKGKIRVMRDLRKWSQEEMAEKMNMSLNGYARIERGETKLTLDKLEQIANIFDMDVLELMQTANKGVCFLLNDSVDNNTITYYGNGEQTLEIEKLKLVIQNKDNILKTKEILLEQKENEIQYLKEIISLLKKDN